MTPVVPHCPYVDRFIIIVGASCSLCPHDRQLHKAGIAANSVNFCTPERTAPTKNYPDVIRRNWGYFKQWMN